MSQITQEAVIIEAAGSLTPDVRDVAVGSIALQGQETFDDERWLGDGGACPAE